eukprot:365858-Chlamydomonas_euryale.AAC.9
MMGEGTCCRAAECHGKRGETSSAAAAATAMTCEAATDSAARRNVGRGRALAAGGRCMQERRVGDGEEGAGGMGRGESGRAAPTRSFLSANGMCAPMRARALLRPT